MATWAIIRSADTNTPPPRTAAQLTLTVSARKIITASLVDLSWSGTETAKIDIYRDGARIITVANTGTYTDRLAHHMPGRYIYRVCAAGTATCSNQSAVTF